MFAWFKSCRCLLNSARVAEKIKRIDTILLMRKLRDCVSKLCRVGSSYCILYPICFKKCPFLLRSEVAPFRVKSALILQNTSWMCTFRLFSGNISWYQSIDVITWANGHKKVENVALILPRERMKLKSSGKCRNLHIISHVYPEISMQPSSLHLIRLMDTQL